MSWHESTLGEACDLYQPKTISGKEMSSAGRYPVYGANGVIGRYHAFNHEEPQLVIGCRGSVGAVHITEPKSWITGNAMVVKPKSHELSVRFVEYYLRGGVDLSPAISGTAQPQITRTSLSPIPISIPPLPEQQRIVAKLDAAFAALGEAEANMERNRANARELFESYLNGVFEGGTDNWNETTLAELPEFFSDGDWIESKDQSPAGIRLVQTGNIGVGEYKDKSEKARFISESTFHRLRCTEVIPGDCLISRLPEPVGRACLVPDLGTRMITGVDCSIVRFDQRRIVPTFFVYFTRTRDYGAEVYSLVTGTTRSRISRSNLGRVSVRHPSVNEQKRIVEELDQLKEKVSAVESTYQQKLDELAALKKGLLGAAFRGEL